ncbi:hypothetical protein AQJ64_36965 [Streptomyces griseoruber]|uniref:Uncharacterized protein n=1 Tax=Streptomyces griseoruber TaxID=1943 RepID=A0A101SMC8_9ACTN|nr:hypothetical protein AQJ64_36965 [Streptomyces griseoruber]
MTTQPDFAYCPADTTLDDLDDYQVRHMTPAMAAHACLTVLHARELDTDKAETDPPSSSTSASPRSDA